MNEKLFTLLQGQNGRCGLEWTEEDKAEFAELIIKECAQVVFKKTGPKSALNVLEHFGVEE